MCDKIVQILTFWPLYLTIELRNVSFGQGNVNVGDMNDVSFLFFSLDLN